MSYEDSRYPIRQDLRGECSCKPQCHPVAGECGVLYEFRLRKTPEGVAILREAERREHSDAIARLEGRDDSADLPYRLQRLGVPVEAIVTLRRPQERPSLVAARKFLGAPRELILFLSLQGPAGVGKTVAAAAVVQATCRRLPRDRATGTREPIVWTPASRLTRLSAFDGADEELLAGMRSAQLLVVDDMGDEGTGLGVSAIVDVLKDREAKKRRSVLTSNVMPDVFRRRYGEGLADRINGKGINPNLWAEKSMRTKPTKETKP